MLNILRTQGRTPRAECDLFMLGLIKHWLNVAQYGGSKPWLRHQMAVAGWCVGFYRSYQAVDWSRVQRLVFVCKGNICRSPYAEVRARTLGLASISMGLDTRPDSLADPQAIRAAALKGIDLAAHRSTLFDSSVLGPGDLLVGFEPWHAQAMLSGAVASGAQVTLAGLWSQPLRPDVGDPHGRTDTYFAVCYEVLDSAVQTMARKSVTKRS
jgi:protein-tyrosine phosphatase